MTKLKDHTYKVELVEGSNGFLGMMYLPPEEAKYAFPGVIPVKCKTPQKLQSVDLFPHEVVEIARLDAVWISGDCWYWTDTSNFKPKWLKSPRPLESDALSVVATEKEKVFLYARKKLAYPNFIRNGFNKVISSENWKITVKVKAVPDANFEEVFRTHDRNFTNNYFEQCIPSLLSVTIESNYAWYTEAYSELRSLVANLDF